MQLARTVRSELATTLQSDEPLVDHLLSCQRGHAFGGLNGDGDGVGAPATATTSARNPALMSYGRPCCGLLTGRDSASLSDNPSLMSDGRPCRGLLTGRDSAPLSGRHGRRCARGCTCGACFGCWAPPLLERVGFAGACDRDVERGSRSITDGTTHSERAHEKQCERDGGGTKPQSGLEPHLSHTNTCVGETPQVTDEQHQRDRNGVRPVGPSRTPRDAPCSLTAAVAVQCDGRRSEAQSRQGRQHEPCPQEAGPDVLAIGHPNTSPRCRRSLRLSVHERRETASDQYDCEQGMVAVGACADPCHSQANHRKKAEPNGAPTIARALRAQHALGSGSRERDGNPKRRYADTTSSSCGKCLPAAPRREPAR